MDKNTLNQLKRFAQAFEEARGRGANESDTVMFLVKFFEDVMGYSSLDGEISKEVAIRDRFCDFAIKLQSAIRFLVEVKAVGNKNLRDKDIEQAENYASRSGINWVLLTNGIEWQLYHVTFSEGEGITHELAFKTCLTSSDETALDQAWAFLQLLSKGAVGKDSLEAFWDRKKALAPASLVRVLFSNEILTLIRRELNRNAEARLEIADVFVALKDVISKDAFAEVGNISLTKKRRRRRKIKKVDLATGQTSEVEVETDEEDDEAGPHPSPVSASPQQQSGAPAG